MNTSMETIAVFINDASTARRALQPMLGKGTSTRWILVACPPALTRHIGRWVSHAARQQWRERWAAELFSAIEPELRSHASCTVETLLAGRPLMTVSAKLLARHPHLRMLDARRPRIGRIDEPIVAAPQGLEGGEWAAPVAAAAGLTLMLSLVD